jgi:hypothetical protein
MDIQKLHDTRPRIPIIATFPYRIVADDLDPESPENGVAYDPTTQRTIYAGRNYSTCRYDEIAGVIASKADTQKDD